MKAIEDAVKPILQPMIHGKYPPKLSKLDQEILARWISLRAIIFNVYSADKTADLFFSEKERFQFLASDRPLSNSVIVLAAALPSNRVNFEPNGFNLRPTNLPIGSGMHFFEVTGMIRQVVFQLIVGKEEWLSGNLINPKGSLGKALKQIWPSPRLRRWPPPSFFGMDGYEGLIGAFGRAMVAQNSSRLSGGMRRPE